MTNSKSVIKVFFEKHPIIRMITKIGFFSLIFLLVFDNIIMPWYVSEKEVEVPNLLNKSKTEAERILEEKNLGYYIAGTHKTDAIPLNHIINQVPDPKSIVKEGRKIAIYVSGGETLVKVPELTGRTSTDAQLLVRKLGLTINRVDTLQSLNPRGTVVRQNLTPNSEVAKGTAIIIAISTGPVEEEESFIDELPEDANEITKIPNLFGKSFNEAKKILEENHLIIGKISKLSSEDLLPNTIMDQHPAPDKTVRKGSSVDLVLVGL
ncbi:MAG TPA: PASTA domain-containing protein [Melioribacteraceae bacterium]|nr:PASTA domain-containing protein [Melioribacteraceae bacterium]